MTDAIALFVYYKLPESLSPDWPRRVAESQAAVKARHPLLQTRLMRRADPSGDGLLATWMEVYEHPDGINPDLQHQILQAMAPLDANLHGGRHLERFIDAPQSGTPHLVTSGLTPQGQN